MELLEAIIVLIPIITILIDFIQTHVKKNSQQYSMQKKLLFNSINMEI
jgi:hypothetical protein